MPLLVIHRVALPLLKEAHNRVVGFIAAHTLRDTANVPIVKRRVALFIVHLSKRGGDRRLGHAAPAHRAREGRQRVVASALRDRLAVGAFGDPALLAAFVPDPPGYGVGDSRDVLGPRDHGNGDGH